MDWVNATEPILVSELLTWKQEAPFVTQIDYEQELLKLVDVAFSSSLDKLDNLIIDIGKKVQGWA